MDKHHIIPAIRFADKYVQFLLCTAESLTWTEQPTNPTVVVNGQDVSLTWRYTLTAEEQTKSQSSFLVAWQKFNDSSSSFDDLAFRLKINLLTNPVFEEQAPHIVVDRATGTDFASLKINNVLISDEGIYKILVSAGTAGNTIDTEQRMNLTVLGKFKLKVLRTTNVLTRAEHVFKKISRKLLGIRRIGHENSISVKIDNQTCYFLVM